MRKLANLISAYIYIFIVKQFTKQTKEEILEGEEISKFGANLVFSSFAFMKDNNFMLHGGKFKPEFYRPWATYFTRFIKEINI